MTEPVNFRDRVSTVNESGERIWVYPKKPKGSFYKARTYLSYIQLIILFAAPFIHINGKPLILIDILNRQFVLLGKTFWPQDFFILGVCIIFLIILVFLFTAIYGRVWCGWLCPQTIFMEMLFRKIEYFIDGDAIAQKKLNSQEWNREKIIKRSSKHIIFFILSFVMGNVFLAYFIGREELYKIITSSPTEHMSGFIAMVLFSLIFYWIYAWFREQLCCFLCPYARLQSVLLDQNSINVIYDYKRGEPRGKPSEKTGDCIDCNLCHAVCPTGIDIRNGTPQLECIQCTACIDACDKVMEKRNKPKGLIRYASQNLIEARQKFKITPRIAVYTFITTVLFLALCYLLITRADLEVTIIRNRGSIPTVINDEVLNVYSASLLNKSGKEVSVIFKLIGRGELDVPGGTRTLKAREKTQVPFFIKLPINASRELTQNITIQVYQNGKATQQLKTTFLGVTR